MTAKTLMVQGTASSAGKSVLVTALCRILKQDGYRVAPFKAQNMALNSFVTREGGEIGRAQAVQAEAAGIEPVVDMNPVLLKPEANSRSQVIVMGKVMQKLRADEYYDHTAYLLKVIESSLSRLRPAYDAVIIEGAGSPAEINLKEKEIVNMRIARLAGAPVVLVGDIDRGGVFASLIGTMMLLEPDEREMVKGLVINKFRGDVELLKPGLEMLEQKAAKPVLGVIPYFRDIGIAQEDSVYLDEKAPAAPGKGLNVAVVRLPHIANYDDFDPLEEMGCTVRYITGPADIGNPHLVVLPGTKNTLDDLAFLHRQGLASEIIRLARSGTPIIGICGGYQMLGKAIRDPLGVESAGTESEGLGLLDCETLFSPAKTTVQVKALPACRRGLLKGMDNEEIAGYEIHMGQTSGQAEPAFRVTHTPEGIVDYFDGAISSNGLVLGTYLHGLFHNRRFMHNLMGFLQDLWGISLPVPVPVNRERQYDDLAANVRRNLDMKKIYEILHRGQACPR